MKYRINDNRIEEISKLFKWIGIYRIKVFEEYDAQFHAAKQIVERCPQTAHYLIYLNSLISYKLMYPGERFWLLFAHYASERCSDLDGFKKVVDLVVDFTLKHNKIMVKQKIDRLRKISRCSDIVDFIDRCEFELISIRTARCLQSESGLKTIVFSVKMLYYAVKAKGYDLVLPNTIPIPVDRRVALLTYLSGLIDVIGETNITPSKLLGISKAIRNIWGRVSLLSSIPPLHIDSVLWCLGKYGYNSSTRSSILNAIDQHLVFSLGEETMRRIVDELFYRLPP
ncbi:MAG: N-glycosylase/DNA lyase [Ignisphaera sp.]|nr:N-glycosylase/DNA lyase [Ignisphaera sp.]MCX8167408.1 N-glycosylase/DNA lyase [Ignisphaera sp.]MDW8085936.1 N-glycosylase/DNA lyase [Ignisphaera sp.]